MLAYEGPTLPSETDLNLARVCHFDLYTLTNFSFMDLALCLGMQPELWAFVRETFGATKEAVTLSDEVLHSGEKVVAPVIAPVTKKDELVLENIEY